MTTQPSEAIPDNRTRIWRLRGDYEDEIGYVASNGGIYRLRWNQGIAVGRVDDQGRVFRTTRHDERELGRFTPDGEIYSHGLFEGGALGWVDSEGYVIQAGLIFGEEEVGRVSGPDANAAGAALLLLFAPDEQEQNRRAERD